MPAAYPPPRQPAAPPDAGLEAFRRALYPILRARDVAAFRRLVADSDDLLGDTADLADWPPTRVRALMAELLREPARFGLPPWPSSAETIPTGRPEAAEPAGNDGRDLAEGSAAIGDPRGAASHQHDRADPLPVEPPAAEASPMERPPAASAAARPRRRSRRAVPPEQLSLW